MFPTGNYPRDIPLQVLRRLSSDQKVWVGGNQKKQAAFGGRTRFTSTRLAHVVVKDFRGWQTLTPRNTVTLRGRNAPPHPASHLIRAASSELRMCGLLLLFERTRDSHGRVLVGRAWGLSPATGRSRSPPALMTCVLGVVVVAVGWWCWFCICASPMVLCASACAPQTL